MLPNTEGKTSILWAQVCGLAAVQGAIALAWVIYNLYLVDLLVALGLSQALATGLLILENILAMAMEPLMGSLSDRMQQQLGTRFPLVSLGVIVSAGLFFLIPTTLFWGMGSALRWSLPLLLVAWALAMTVFRSPALSLLGRYAFATHLPQAASVLTLVGGVAGAMGPLASQFILGMGPMVAFGLGSVVLLIAAIALRLVQPDAAIASLDSDAPRLESRGMSWLGLGLVFGAGVGISLGFRLMMGTFPAVLRGQVPDARVSLILGSIFVSLALTALPAGVLALRLGNRRAMILGLAGMALVCGAIVAVQTNFMGVLLALIFGAAFSLVSNGTLPFALSMVPAHRAGLGTGLFFSGGAAANSLFGVAFGSTNTFSPSFTALLGAFAFLLAGICVGSAARHRPPLALPD